MHKRVVFHMQSADVCLAMKLLHPVDRLLFQTFTIVLFNKIAIQVTRQMAGDKEAIL